MLPVGHWQFMVVSMGNADNRLMCPFLCSSLECSVQCRLVFPHMCTLDLVCMDACRCLLVEEELVRQVSFLFMSRAGCHAVSPLLFSGGRAIFSSGLSILIMAITCIILALITCPIVIDCAHIGLFASTGCYSHDVMMRNFADRLTSVEGGSHQVTLIQIRVFEFSLASTSNKTSNTTSWTLVSCDAQDQASMETLGYLQVQMWQNMVPFDIDLPTNLHGVKYLNRLHNHQIDACYKALKDGSFIEKVKKLRLDLLVTDYVLNECALRFNHLLDVNLAYLSNYPVLSSYAADLGISSNPSYVPSVIGYEATKMDFSHRLPNALLYFLLWSSRQWFDYDANRVFKRALGNRFFKKTRSKGRSVLTFSTPFESILDTPRPVARNLHYFGCDHCFDGRDKTKTVSELLNISIPVDGDGIILVTFGTVTAAERTPVIQLQRLIRTFAKFPSYTFIWQLDLPDFADRVLKSINFPAPSNVHLFPWVPLKQLMADKRVILSINHGGMSTCSEAIHHGIPIFGLALQGDQGYNLRRLFEKDVAVMIPISHLTDEIVFDKLSMMIRDIDRYQTTARKLRSMIRDHKSLYKGDSPSVFWVGWTARHFGRARNVSESAIKAKRFLKLRNPSNWFVYYSLDILLAFVTGMAMLIWIGVAMRNMVISVIWSDQKGIRFGSA